MLNTVSPLTKADNAEADRPVNSFSLSTLPGVSHTRWVSDVNINILIFNISSYGKGGGSGSGSACIVKGSYCSW